MNFNPVALVLLTVSALILYLLISKRMDSFTAAIQGRTVPAKGSHKKVK